MNPLPWLVARPVRSLLLLTLVPFLVLPGLLISPLVFSADEDLWTHAVFHLLYLPVIAVSLVLLFRLLGTRASRGRRLLYALLLAVQSAAAFGHGGELVVTIQQGFLDAPESVFDRADHTFFANFAVFGLMLGCVLALVVAVAAGIGRLTRRNRPLDVPV